MLVAARGTLFDPLLDAALTAALGDGGAALAARGLANAPAGAGVKRSPIVGMAGRGDIFAAGFGAALGDGVAGLSVGRTDAEREPGAGRSLPSGGGLDPVTTECPLLQAASSTLEGSPSNGNVMFADSAGSAQYSDVANHPSWIAGE